MRLLISTLIVLFGFSVCYGQTTTKVIKTEKISYNEGFATFQCYEDSKTGDLIKHGVFSYSENQKGQFGTQVRTISGQFKDGYRDGVWNYSEKRIDAENIGGDYSTGTLTSSQSFKDGYPNGPWKFNNSYRTRSRIRVGNNYTWSQYSSTVVESASLSFKKGTMVGLVDYTVDEKHKLININQDGFVIGSLKEESVGTISEMAFNQNGVMTKLIERGSATGTVTYKIDFDPELLKIADEYVAGRISITDLKEAYIKVDTIGGVGEDASLLFNIDFFLLPGIDGDKTISHGSNLRIPGRYLKFERIKIVPYEEHPQWIKQSSGYSSAKDKIQCYEKFLTLYGYEISKQDYATIQQLIKNARNELGLEMQQKDSKLQYTDLYNQLKAKLKMPVKPSKTAGATPYSTNTHVYYKDTKNTLISCVQKGRYLFFEYKAGDEFLPNGYKGKENDYVSSLKLIQEYTAFLDKKQLSVDSLSTSFCWLMDISFNVNEIECKYIINQTNTTFNVYSETNPKETEKPKLYKPYLNVFENLLKETKMSRSYSEYYNNVSMLNDLCWFVVRARDFSTSAVEKELKGTTDYKSQLEIFKKAINSPDYKKE